VVATVRTASRRLRGERGAEMVEFALVLPLLLVVVGGIIDFGLMFQRWEVVTNAAREGARISALPDYTLADVQARVNAYVAAGIAADATATTTMTDVTLAVPNGQPIQMRRVQVQYESRSILLGNALRLIGNKTGAFNTITLTARSTMRREVPAP
jgi:Flp pilus assembly protein TadG